MKTTYHTSSEIITEISPCGMFGECLFFSNDVYQMNQSATNVYSLEIDEDDIIEASSFFYQEDCEKLNDLVLEVMDIADCDEDTAQEFLSQNQSHEDAETDWEIQGLTGMCAKALGYKAAEATDEQGCVYIVPMFGRESDLKLD